MGLFKAVTLTVLDMQEQSTVHFPLTACLCLL